MTFNKFDIRTNLRNTQAGIFKAEEVLEKGSYPRQELYKIRVAIGNVIYYLDDNPECCPK